MRKNFSFLLIFSLIYEFLQQNKPACSEKDLKYKFGECKEGLHKGKLK